MNWNETKLKKYCKVVSGYAFKSDGFVEKGIPVLKIANISDYTTKFTSDDSFIPENQVSNYKEFILKEKDIVIALSGNTTCKMGRVNNLFSPSFLNQRVGHFRILDEENLCENYLYFLMISDTIQKRLWNKATATGQPNLSPSDITKLNVYLPPKPEQQKIAAILTKVDDAIQSVKNTIEKAGRLKKALMQNLLTGKLKPDGTWRRDDEFYEDEKFGKVPVGWAIKKLGNILSCCQYGLSKSMNESGKYPIFRMNNIENGKMVSSPMVYVDLGDDEFEKYKVNKGNIIFNRTNSIDLVGKVGIFDLADDYVFASYLIRLTITESNNPFYINYYLNYYDGQKKIKSKVTPSVSQANINASNLKSIRIPVPNEKPEQDKIVKLIKKMESQIDIKNAKIQKLERLKKALMQNLLTGKIRLNLD